MTSAYAGVDVAIAMRKRLPVVLVRWEGDRLVPFELKSLRARPPLGFGNVGALDPEFLERFGRQALAYLEEVEHELGVTIQRLAIDAPSAPRHESLPRRACESAMDRQGISVFTTPSRAEFCRIRERCRDHLASCGAVSRLPHANQLWMLAGFQLFRSLIRFSPIETYPQAIVRSLAAGTKHKRNAYGLAAQMQAVSGKVGLPSLSRDLANASFGSRHDKLDAFMCAWVAATDPDSLVAYGEPPFDVIWTPRPG